MHTDFMVLMNIPRPSPQVRFLSICSAVCIVVCVRFPIYGHNCGANMVFINGEISGLVFCTLFMACITSSPCLNQSNDFNLVRVNKYGYRQI